MKKIRKALFDGLRLRKPHLKVSDLTHLAEPHMTKTTHKACEKYSKTLSVVDSEGKIYRTLFMSSVYKIGSEEKAAKRLAEDLNKLSEKGLIHSILAPISSMQLVRESGHHQMIAVFCFPLVPIDKMEEITGMVDHVEEGETGKFVDDSFALPEGDFFAEICVDSTYMGTNKIAAENLIQQEIDLYLSILPKGTEIVSRTEMLISGLSVPTEIIFRNPLMKKYKQVKLDFHREIAVIDDKIDEFNLLKSVEYIKR